jgi:hypothetical protein
MSTTKRLEPFMTLCRIATLAFSPIGTKIAIRNNALILCEPLYAYGILGVFKQSIDRTYNGDSRDDLFVLNSVIIEFNEKYILYYKSQNKEIYLKLINLVKYACVGLLLLKKTYGENLTSIAIHSYITGLISIINDDFHEGILHNNEMSINDEIRYLNDVQLKDIVCEFDRCFQPVVQYEEFHDACDDTTQKEGCVSHDFGFGSTDQSDIYIRQRTYIKNLPIKRDEIKEPYVRGAIVSIKGILEKYEASYLFHNI